MRIIILFALTGVCCAALYAATSSGSTPRKQSYAIHPVGTVEINGDETLLRIDEEYAEALRGLDQFSHVWVFYWFDKNDTPAKRRILTVHPRGNPKNPLTGVFATRSPVRPNLIALTSCRILSISGNLVKVDKIDAFPGSPIVDLKPYVPGIDCRPDAKGPAWVDR